MNRSGSALANMARMNLQVLERVSDYLTRHPRLIGRADVEEIAALGVGREEAVLMLLAGACGVETDTREGRAVMERYLRPSLARLDAADLADNPYLRLIRFPKAKAGRWEMATLSYAPYELFVRDELDVRRDGREIPRLGYFETEFVYPAVLEDGREWMTITPNEIATMRAAIDAAKGDVVAMGLGLGYFALMASEKDDVSSVTVVERDRQVIALFDRFILPQFPHREKVRVVCADAFAYAKDTLPGAEADFVFVDLWHDTLDGAPMYMKMKRLEALSPGKAFAYWIEPSILSLLRGLAVEAWTAGETQAFAGVIRADMDEEEVSEALSDERLRACAARLDAGRMGF